MAIPKILQNRFVVFAHDVCVIPLAWFGAYLLRFNLDELPAEMLAQALYLLPVILIIQTAAFWGFGLYRGVWRYASMPDLMRILKAVSLGSILAMLTIFLITRLEGVPRSIFPLYAMLLVIALGGARFAVRWRKDHSRFGSFFALRRVLIVGTEGAGESLVREFNREPAQGYLAVGFIDDGNQQQGREIRGVRVVGRVSDIPTQVSRLAADLIVIAKPGISGQKLKHILEVSAQTGKPVRLLPDVRDLVDGRVKISGLREVSLEDLLGREPVELDWEQIGEDLHSKTIMVTGGGGSIGSELCQQIVQLEPKHLIIIDSSEYNLFQLEQTLTRDARCKMSFVLSDVRNTPRIKRLMQRYSPNIVFHAAAYKHVPLLEPQIESALLNNVMGTQAMCALSVRHRVEKFVLVSTDKAVNPTNVMGASKRLAEMLCQHHQSAPENITRFMIVRFGNVLGSTGSVIPTFRAQLASGGPITVTDAEVMRYFMSIPEAAQLILQASALGQGGEIFVLDMGEAIKIRDLAEQMIRLAGKRVGEDIQITYTGLRPGEKLREELVHHTEQTVDTPHKKISRVCARSVPEDLDATLRKIEIGLETGDTGQLLAALKQLVPEFVSQSDRLSRTAKEDALIA